tara:strand:+ start:3335 stop:4624 length:1290 start_codon:yes stop_codon:yes gene_type:complete
MTEIFKIAIIFFVLVVFFIGPLNIFDKTNKELRINVLNYNFIINFNILLFLSLISLPIKNYQLIYITILLLTFFYTLLVSKISYFHLIKKNIINFSIIYFSFFIIAINISSNLNFGWDAKYFYYIKSLFFFEGLGLNELREFEHNKWHPHFGSYLWAFFWSLPFMEIEYFGRLSYVFIFCFSIYFITKIPNNNYHSVLLYLVILILLFKYDRFSGLQEILIFSYLSIASKILYDLENKKKILDLIMLILITNLIMWIKAEGIVYSLIILTIFLFNNKVIVKEKVFIFLIFMIFVSLKYNVYLLYDLELNAQPYNFESFFSLSIENLYYRFEKILIYLGYYSLINPIFLIGVILTILLNFLNNDKILTKNFNIYFILNTLFIFSAYLLRDLEIVYSLKTTLERIVFTSSGFYVYLIIIFINKKFKKWKIS